MMSQRFTLDQDKSSQFHSKDDLVKDFIDERNKFINENYKLMQEVRRSTPVGTSLLTVGEKDSSILKIATNNQEQVSQVKIQMEKIGILDKINFHKQATKILYFDLLKYYLNKIKLETKVVKLEDQIKREKDASKGWKVQVKKLETDLVNLGSNPNEKKSNKKFKDEKDKLIESLQKKLKGIVTDHPQTEDVMVIQSKNEELKKEVMELKSKLLQVTKEKEELSNKNMVEASFITSQQIVTVELTRSLAQTSLKDKVTSQLIKEKYLLEKYNQQKQENIDKLKARLKRKEALQSTQHSLWDLISVEVNKFSSELGRMEAKKPYIYSTLEKYKLAIEQLAHVHKDPIQKSQMIMNFLKLSSNEALHAFKVNG